MFHGSGPGSPPLDENEQVFDDDDVGFTNPDVSWKEVERRLSDRAHPGRPTRAPVGANGGDSPAWSPVRSAYEPPPGLTPGRLSGGDF